MWLLWQQNLMSAQDDNETATVSRDFLLQKSIQEPPSQQHTSFRTQTVTDFEREWARDVLLSEVALCVFVCMCVYACVYVYSACYFRRVSASLLLVCALRQKIWGSGPHPSPLPVLRYLTYHCVCVNLYSLCESINANIFLNSEFNQAI